MGKPVALATLVAGTLDILFAVVLTLLYGRAPGDMLRYVASGPFRAATDMGTAGALLGLFVHFTLIAIMATVYVLFARQRPQLLAKPVQWGVLYGFATYFVMNWMVVPLRFGTGLPPSLMGAMTQLFAHVVLVGIPIALIAARTRRRPS